MLANGLNIWTPVLSGDGEPKLPAGLTAWWTFDQTMAEVSGLNDFTYTGTEDYVSDGAGGYGIDVAIGEYYEKESPDNSIRTPVGSIELVYEISGAGAPIPFGASVRDIPDGLLDDQFRIQVVNDGGTTTFLINVVEAGVNKIIWSYDALGFVSAGKHIVIVSADGSGTSATGYKVTLDGVAQVAYAMSADVSGYRGLWLGSTVFDGLDWIGYGRDRGAGQQAAIFPLKVYDIKLYDSAILHA